MKIRKNHKAKRYFKNNFKLLIFTLKITYDTKTKKVKGGR